MFSLSVVDPLNILFRFFHCDIHCLNVFIDSRCIPRVIGPGDNSLRFKKFEVAGWVEAVFSSLLAAGQR